MKAIFLFLCLLVGVVYNTLPYDSNPLSMFMYSDTTLPFKTWLYFLCEHIVLVMLAYVIAAESRTYRLSCKVFFWIQVAGMIDYLLTYNTNWIGFINFNIISVIIFAGSILYEYGRGSD